MLENFRIGLAALRRYPGFWRRAKEAGLDPWKTTRLLGRLGKEHGRDLDKWWPGLTTLDQYMYLGYQVGQGKMSVGEALRDLLKEAIRRKDPFAVIPIPKDWRRFGQINRAMKESGLPRGQLLKFLAKEGWRNRDFGNVVYGIKANPWSRGQVLGTLALTGVGTTAAGVGLVKGAQALRGGSGSNRTRPPAQTSQPSTQRSGSAAPSTAQPQQTPGRSAPGGSSGGMPSRPVPELGGTATRPPLQFSSEFSRYIK
jgi:hypothetical protein